jgi:hypothetical protein
MRSKRDAVQGWDTLVRGTISKGRFVQGEQHPRTFGRGHIGRGHINRTLSSRSNLADWSLLAFLFKNIVCCFLLTQTHCMAHSIIWTFLIQYFIGAVHRHSLQYIHKRFTLLIETKGTEVFATFLVAR